MLFFSGFVHRATPTTTSFLPARAVHAWCIGCRQCGSRTQQTRKNPILSAVNLSVGDANNLGTLGKVAPQRNLTDRPAISQWEAQIYLLLILIHGDVWSVIGRLRNLKKISRSRTCDCELVPGNLSQGYPNPKWQNKILYITSPSCMMMAPWSKLSWGCVEMGSSVVALPQSLHCRIL
jgi:hypothetical protein